MCVCVCVCVCVQSYDVNVNHKYAVVQYSVLRKRDGWRGRGSPDFDIVGEEPAVDGLGCVSHEHSSFECGLHQHIILAILFS